MVDGMLVKMAKLWRARFRKMRRWQEVLRENKDKQELLSARQETGEL